MSFKRGVRSAERGTTSLRYTALTRKVFNAECIMQNAKLPRFASLHSHGFLVKHDRLRSLDEIRRKGKLH